MDPLSVTAGIIAIGGFTTASLKVILKVRGASDEIQALINEISDLSAIVKDVEHTLLHNKHLSKETPGFSSLHTVLITKYFRAVFTDRDFLEEHGADPGYRNDNGWNALYAAVNHSKLDCTNLLLSHGFTEYKDGYGMSTLHRACQQTDPTYVKLILKHDPNVDSKAWVKGLPGKPQIDCRHHKSCSSGPEGLSWPLSTQQLPGYHKD